MRLPSDSEEYGVSREGLSLTVLLTIHPLPG